MSPALIAVCPRHCSKLDLNQSVLHRWCSAPVFSGRLGSLVN